MQLETQRLLLRELTAEDADALCAVLQDAETMRYYCAPFDRAKVEAWIERNISRYATFGFGLWAVTLRESGLVIGDAGITMQNIDGEIKPELGYHIRRDLQRRGYGREAALKCRDYIFENTPFNMLYSYMKYTNAPSRGLAESVGMRFLREYPDPVNTFSAIYAISRADWVGRKAKSDPAAP